MTPIKKEGILGEAMKSELTKIPGIGINMAENLIRAGFPTIESLHGKSPDDAFL